MRWEYYWTLVLRTPLGRAVSSYARQQKRPLPGPLGETGLLTYLTQTDLNLYVGNRRIGPGIPYICSMQTNGAPESDIRPLQFRCRWSPCRRRTTAVCWISYSFDNRFMNRDRDQSGLTPTVQWWCHYPKAWLRPDITAGCRLAAQ